MPYSFSSREKPKSDWKGIFRKRLSLYACVIGMPKARRKTENMVGDFIVWLLSKFL